MHDEKIKELIAKGLTEPEAIEAAAWPGGSLKPYHFNKAYALYMEGATCESIAFLHPEYSVSSLLNARVQFEWDKHREYHKQKTVMEAVNSGDRIQPVALTLAHRLIKSLDARYRKAMEDYIADPHNNKFPEMNPDHFIQFKEGVKIARDIMGLNDKDLKDKPTAAILTPIIKIKVSTQSNQPMKIAAPIIEIDPVEMRRQRLLDAGMLEEDNVVQPTGKSPSPTDG